MVEKVLLDAIANGGIPEDVPISYLAERRDMPATVAIIAVTSATFLAVLGRALCRSMMVGRFGIDDGLAVLGLLLLIAFSVLCIELIRIGSGRHYEYIQYAMPAQVVKDSEVLDFTAHLVYTTALFAGRLSGLAFYHRLCGDHRRFAVAIRVTIGILFAGYLPQIFSIVFHCLPVTGYWPYDWEPHFANYKCLAWGVVYVVNSGVSLFCDFILFGIPVAMIWMLEIPRRRKLQLAGILMPGILVVGISITRLILVVKGQWEPDMSWSYNPMLAVEVSEIGATLIALSVPGLKPLVDKFICGNPIEALQRRPNKRRIPSGPEQASHTTRPSDGFRTLQSSNNPRLLSDKTLEKHIQTRYDVESGNCWHKRDDTSSGDGILVRVDFNMKEESRN